MSSTPARADQSERARLVQACASTAPTLFDRQFPRPWCSTGLYPQIFVCALKPNVEVSAVEIVTKGVAAISLRGCQAGQTPVHIDCRHYDSRSWQDETHSFSFDPTFWDSLHFVVTSGFGDFCVVTQITVTGKQHKGRGSHGRATSAADKEKCDVINQRLDTARESLECKWRRKRESKRSRKQAPPLSSPTQQQHTKCVAGVDAAA